MAMTLHGEDEAAEVGGVSLVQATREADLDTVRWAVIGGERARDHDPHLWLARSLLESYGRGGTATINKLDSSKVEREILEL